MYRSPGTSKKFLSASFSASLRLRVKKAFPKALSGLLLATALSAQSTPARVVVARADARLEANDTSQIVFRIGYGQILDVRGTAGDYLQVIERTPSRGQMRITGYVPRADISPDAEPKPSSKVEGIAISVDVPGKSYWLTASPTRAVPVSGALESIGALAGGRLVGTALAGATPMPADRSETVSWVWLAAQGAASTVVEGTRPEIMALFNHATNMSIDEMVPALVRLVPAGDSGWSALTVARGRADAPLRTDADWLIAKALQQDTVAVATKAGGSGIITIRPTVALTPGEYAVVLRPFYGKKFAGDVIFARDGDGLAFSTAWRITIKP